MRHSLPSLQCGEDKAVERHSVTLSRDFTRASPVRSTRCESHCRPSSCRRGMSASVAARRHRPAASPRGRKPQRSSSPRRRGPCVKPLRSRLRGNDQSGAIFRGARKITARCRWRQKPEQRHDAGRQRVARALEGHHGELSGFLFTEREEADYKRDNAARTANHTCITTGRKLSRISRNCGTCAGSGKAPTATAWNKPTPRE